jgi:hypothetical protein
MTSNPRIDVGPHGAGVGTSLTVRASSTWGPIVAVILGIAAVFVHLAVSSATGSGSIVIGAVGVIALLFSIRTFRAGSSEIAHVASLMGVALATIGLLLLAIRAILHT